MQKNETILQSITGDEEEKKIILEPFNYIHKMLKRESVILAHGFNHWLNIPKDKLDAIIEITDIFYTFWLVLDDIQDSTNFRQGVLTPHKVYGTARAINSSCYALHIALEKVLALNHPKAPQIFTDGLLNTSRGQGIRLYWRQNNICPSESAYKKAIIDAADILQNTVNLMQLFSDCKTDFTPLIQTFGYYFQIRNDYFDFLEEDDNKTFAVDLTEGEFNFPIMHAIQSHPEDTRVMDILRKRVKDIDLKRDCVKLLDRFGSFTYTKSVLEDLDKKLRDEIKRLGGNPIFEKFFDSLLDWKTKNVS